MSKLEFVYASMNSGKTLTLITKHFMLKEKGFKVVVFKPETDTRTKFIKSRVGLEVPCVNIKESTKISDLVLKSRFTKPDFILCDESQFFTKEQIWDLAFLVDNWDINVICYGLRLDWKGNFFEGSEELMKISDVLTPIENYCNVEKGAFAFFHTKHSGSGESVEVGYEDVYSSVSRKTWREWYDTLNDNSGNT